MDKQKPRAWRRPGLFLTFKRALKMTVNYNMCYENGVLIPAIIPIAANLDHRMTLIQYRVLIAILSYRNKVSGTAIVKRSAIAERCGYSEQKVSYATTALADLGWLKKVGDGGRSRPCEYRITVPDSETVPESGTVPDSGTKTVPESGRGKEQSIEQSSVLLLGAQAANAGEEPGDPPAVSPTRRGLLAKTLREQGVVITPIHPELCQWVNSEITDEELQEAVDRARLNKPAPNPIPAGYLAPIVRAVIGERATRSQTCQPAPFNAKPNLNTRSSGGHYVHKSQTRSAIFEYAIGGHGAGFPRVHGAGDDVSQSLEPCGLLN
jgi:hypothetical protein